MFAKELWAAIAGVVGAAGAMLWYLDNADSISFLGLAKPLSEESLGRNRGGARCQRRRHVGGTARPLLLG